MEVIIAFPRVLYIHKVTIGKSLYDHCVCLRMCDTFVRGPCVCISGFKLSTVLLLLGFYMFNLIYAECERVWVGGLTQIFTFEDSACQWFSKHLTTLV